MGFISSSLILLGKSSFGKIKTAQSFSRCVTFGHLKALQISRIIHSWGSLFLALFPPLGSPEEVLAKNKLTYNVKLGTITPRALVVLQRLQYAKGAYLTFPNIPQAFALDQDLQPVSGFEAFIDVRLNTYKIERLIYENI